MPTYNVKLAINIPGSGNQEITLPGIAASSLDEAIATAKSGIKVRVIHVIETAQ